MYLFAHTSILVQEFKHLRLGAKCNWDSRRKEAMVSLHFILFLKLHTRHHCRLNSSDFKKRMYHFGRCRLGEERD